jgi:cytochrome c556
VGRAPAYDQGEVQQEASMRGLAIGLLAAASVLGLSAAAMALDADGAIKYRKTVMGAVKSHFGAMFAVMKSPDILGADLLPHAEALAATAKMPWKAFGPGTASGTEKTEARPEIWSDPAGFKTEAAKFEIATAELLAAVKSQDKAAISAKMQVTGVMCKSCHDKFKQ